MELTASERAELDALRLAFGYARYDPADAELRPPTKAAFRAKRDKLNSLKKAWAALDADTQWILVVRLNEMWNDEVQDRLPDIAPVVDEILEHMMKPNGAPEQLPGLRRAASILWSAWCEKQGGGIVPIGREVVQEIGAEISAMFHIEGNDAEDRVRNALRDMEKKGFLPRRATTRRD